jgi:hypothetical protein
MLPCQSWTADEILNEYSDVVHLLKPRNVKQLYPRGRDKWDKTMWHPSPRVDWQVRFTNTGDLKIVLVAQGCLVGHAILAMERAVEEGEIPMRPKRVEVVVEGTKCGRGWGDACAGSPMCAQDLADLLTGMVILKS